MSEPYFRYSSMNFCRRSLSDFELRIAQSEINRAYKDTKPELEAMLANFNLMTKTPPWKCVWMITTMSNGIITHSCHVKTLTGDIEIGFCHPQHISVKFPRKFGKVRAGRGSYTAAKSPQEALKEVRRWIMTSKVHK